MQIHNIQVRRIQSIKAPPYAPSNRARGVIEIRGSETVSTTLGYLSQAHQLLAGHKDIGAYLTSL